MLRRTVSLSLSLTLVFVAVVSQAWAVPTQMTHFDTPNCDTLSIPTNVHEIGDTIEFPSNEALSSADRGQTALSPCPNQDDSQIPNALVAITNLSGIDWHEVWYVADQAGGTSLEEAFRIDSPISDPGGSHHPLFSESGLVDDIWQAGETWEFILQDYTNLLSLPPDALTSIGVGSLSSAPTVVGPGGFVLGPSSGSIIAITPIPEPATCLLMLMGLGGILLCRKEK